MKQYIVMSLFPGGWEEKSFSNKKLAMNEYLNRLSTAPNRHHSLELKQVIKSNWK